MALPECTPGEVIEVSELIAYIDENATEGPEGPPGPEGPDGPPGTTDHLGLLNIGTNTHGEIDTHILNVDNPHNVTYNNIQGDQPVPVAHTHVENDVTDLDKYTQAQTDAAIAVVQDDVDTHEARTDNPHEVNYDDIQGTQPAPVSHTHVEAEITDLVHYNDTDADARVQAAIQDDVISLSTLYSSSKIEDTISGSLVYKGTWNASTNTPVLSDGVGELGDFYKVNVAGTQNLGSGSIDFIIGDRLVYSGTEWQRVPESSTANWGKIYGVLSDQDDLQGELNSKSDINHTHVESQITDLDKYTQAEVDAAVKVPQDAIDAHEILVNNPHSVTQTQVGLGNVDDTADVDKPISTDTQTALDTKVLWKGLWVNATYYMNDMVRDGVYTSIAVVPVTTDRPAPQNIGYGGFLYAGTLTPYEQSAKQVIFGTRYVTASPISLTGYRVDVVEGNEYHLYSIKDPLGVPIVSQLNSFIAVTTGWVNIFAEAFIVGSGLTFDIICEVVEPAGTPTVIALNYDYDTPNNSGTPAVGQIEHSNADTANLLVRKTDDDGNDNSTFLEGLTPGDVIELDTARWTIQNVVDDGTYMTYQVSPAVQYGTDGVQGFNFETVTSTPITVGYELDANLLTSSGGLYIVDGRYIDIVPDDNQYGIDIEVQEISMSSDWQVVATSASADSGEEGGVTVEIVDNLTTQDSSVALSGNMGYVLDQNMQTHEGAANPHNVTYEQLGGTQPVPVAHSHTESDISDLSHYTDGEADARVQAAIQDTTISVSTLYSSTKIQEIVEGSLTFEGTWDANTNTPTLTDGVGITGQFYKVTVAGTINLGSGSIDFIVGDRVVYNTSGVWDRVPETTVSNWGQIYGTLSEQTDLQDELNGKSDSGHNHDGVYEPADSGIQTHIDDVTTNPHGVTKTQVGLPNVPDTIAQDLADHEGDTGNPHATTVVNLSDTSIVNASEGQRLSYNESTGMWEGRNSVSGLGFVVFDYVFFTATDDDPLEGQVHMNNVDPTLVTELYFHQNSRTGEDVDAYWGEIKEGDWFNLFRSNDSSIFYSFDVTAPGVKNGDVWTIPVTSYLVQGTLSNNKQIKALWRITPTQVVDNLVTQRADFSLSANQGYVLDQKILTMQDFATIEDVNNGVVGKIVTSDILRQALDEIKVSMLTCSDLEFTNCWNNLIQLGDSWYGYDFAQDPTGNMTPVITSEGSQIYANKFDAVSGDFVISFGSAGNEKAGDALEAVITFSNGVHVSMVWDEVSLRYEGNNIDTATTLASQVNTHVCFAAVVIPYNLIDYTFYELEVK